MENSLEQIQQIRGKFFIPNNYEFEFGKDIFNQRKGYVLFLSFFCRSLKIKGNVIAAETL